MNVQEIDVNLIDIPHWNPNWMSPGMRQHLRHSLDRFGIFIPLVVRPQTVRFETIGGAQRLGLLREMGYVTAPCVVIEADDATARLMTQALNLIEGEDDPLKQADLLRDLLDDHSREEIADLIPGVRDTFRALDSIGDASVANHLRDWEQRRAQTPKLRHVTLQLTDSQLPVVEEAIAAALRVKDVTASINPNVRGKAFYDISKFYLNGIERED